MDVGGAFFDITLLTPVFGRAPDRLRRLDHPPHRHRRLRHRRRRARHPRGRPVDPAAQFYDRGCPTSLCTTSSAATCAPPTTCSATWRRRCPAAAPAASAWWRCASATGWWTSRRLSDEIIRRSDEATRAAIRKLQAGHLPRRKPLRRAGRRDHHPQGRGHHRRRRRRGADRLYRQFRRQCRRHQRGDELHPRLFHLRHPQLPQSRPAQQPRFAGADQGQRAQGFDRQLRIPVAGQRPPVVGMYVPCPSSRRCTT